LTKEVRGSIVSFPQCTSKKLDGRGFARRGVEWLDTTAVVGVAPAGRATPATPVNIYIKLPALRFIVNLVVLDDSQLQKLEATKHTWSPYVTVGRDASHASHGAVAPHKRLFVV